MKYVIAFTATNRPDYLRQTLDSWRRVRGIDQAYLTFKCEPGCPEVEEICRAVDFGGALTVEVNPEAYGPLTNPWHAMEAGWNRARLYGGLDFVIIAEDDTIVSSDVLEFFDWAADKYKHDSGVITVGAHQHDALGDFYDVVRMRKFHSWIWGTWLDRWCVLRDDWDHDYRHRGWDHRITDYWLNERGFVNIGPAMSRSQDIGMHGGVHSLPSDFPNAVSSCFTLDIPPQEYREQK